MTLEEIQRELEQVGMLLMSLAERADAEFVATVYANGHACVVSNVTPERVDEIYRASLETPAEEVTSIEVQGGQS